jgi:predicted nucleic-acid-binding protein
MQAVDTNILVRVIMVGDDHAQATRAKALMAQDTIFISKTVLLETEWVLRRGYEIERHVVINAFRRLIATQEIVIEDSDIVDHAFGWWEDGMDFADALHLASSHRCNKFYTFDRKLKKLAPKNQFTTVNLL